MSKLGLFDHIYKQYFSNSPRTEFDALVSLILNNRLSSKEAIDRKLKKLIAQNNRKQIKELEEIVQIIICTNYLYNMSNKTKEEKMSAESEEQRIEKLESYLSDIQIELKTIRELFEKAKADTQSQQRSLEKTLSNKRASESLGEIANRDRAKYLLTVLGTVAFTTFICFVSIQTVIGVEDAKFQFSLNIAELVAGLTGGIGVLLAGVSYSYKTMTETAPRNE